MSSELSRLYQSLANDVPEMMMAEPETVRRRADHRARVRTSAVLATVAVVLAGTAVGTNLVLTSSDRSTVLPAETPTPPAPPTTPVPSVPPSPTGGPSSGTPTGNASSGTPTTSPARPIPTSIPDRAFFELPASYDRWEKARFSGSEDMLPEMCGADQPADGRLLARRTRHLIYFLPSAPAGSVPQGTVEHTITSYPVDAARSWMDQFRAAVRECPTRTSNGRTYRHRLLDAPRLGDDSLLLQIRFPSVDVNGKPTGGEEIQLVRVVRINGVVTVLFDRGWEGTSSDRAVLDVFARQAVNAINAWLD